MVFMQRWNLNIYTQDSLLIEIILPLTDKVKSSVVIVVF